VWGPTPAGFCCADSPLLRPPGGRVMDSQRLEQTSSWSRLHHCEWLAPLGGDVLLRGQWAGSHRAAAIHTSLSGGAGVRVQCIHLLLYTSQQPCCLLEAGLGRRVRIGLPPMRNAPIPRASAHPRARFGRQGPRRPHALYTPFDCFHHAKAPLALTHGPTPTCRPGDPPPVPAAIAMSFR
jgi:hypothetical protein